MVKCKLCGIVLKLQTAKSKMCRPCFVSEKTRNANPKKCPDCDRVLANRGQRAVRCRKCWIAKEKEGRKLPNCKCGNKISTKIGTRCRSCYLKERGPAWNKGTKGVCKPWNKGASVFKTEEERKNNTLSKRRERWSKSSLLSRMPDSIRTLIRNSFRRKGVPSKGGKKTVFYLGCGIQEFISHLEKQFTDGMSWENYGNGNGRWNVDHIVPISKFDLSKEDQARAVFHYSNCRPMWAIDNIKKGNKIPAAAALTFVVTF